MVQSVLHEIGGKGEHGHLHRKGALGHPMGKALNNRTLK